MAAGLQNCKCSVKEAWIWECLLNVSIHSYHCCFNVCSLSPEAGCHDRIFVTVQVLHVDSAMTRRLPCSSHFIIKKSPCYSTLRKSWTWENVVNFTKKYGKVVFTRYLGQAMNTHGVVEVQLHYFYTSALDGDEWLALRPGRLTPMGMTTPCPLDRRLDPRGGLDIEVGDKSFAPTGNRKPIF